MQVHTLYEALSRRRRSGGAGGWEWGEEEWREGYRDREKKKDKEAHPHPLSSF